jgi:hypothetical protein
MAPYSIISSATLAVVLNVQAEGQFMATLNERDHLVRVRICQVRVSDLKAQLIKAIRKLNFTRARVGRK